MTVYSDSGGTMIAHFPFDFICHNPGMLVCHIQLVKHLKGGGIVWLPVHVSLPEELGRTTTFWPTEEQVVSSDFTFS